MADNSLAAKTGNPNVQYVAGQIESSSAAYAFFGTTSNPTPGAGGVYYRNTYRDGDCAIIRYEFFQTAAGSAGSGDYLLPIPTGLTIDYSRLGPTTSSSGVLTYCGEGYMQVNGATLYFAKCYSANASVYTNRIAIVLMNDATPTTGWGSGLVPLSTAGIRVALTVRVPILEWAGQSTVAIGAGSASPNKDGLVNQLAQSFAGDKTFLGTTSLATSTKIGFYGRVYTEYLSAFAGASTVPTLIPIAQTNGTSGGILTLTGNGATGVTGTVIINVAIRTAGGASPDVASTVISAIGVFGTSAFSISGNGSFVTITNGTGGTVNLRYMYVGA